MAPAPIAARIDRKPSSIHETSASGTNEEQSPDRDRSRERQDPEQAHHRQRLPVGHPRTDTPEVPRLEAAGSTRC